MSARKFSIFPKISEAMDLLQTEEEQAAFCRAVMRYGAFGEEPEGLGYPMNVLFTAIREDIENSAKQAESGAKGGSSKGRKAPSEETGSTLDAETGSTLGGKTEAKPNHTKPNQTKPRRGGRAQARAGADGCGCVPPSLDEVREYFAANCLRGDPDLFYANAAESGWKTPKGLPIEDWHGSAMKWHLREPEFEQSRRSREEADRLRVERLKPPEARAPAESLPVAVNAVDWEAEYAALGGEG